MVIRELVIPQLGEGLYQVQIVSFLKEPGDSVARDEPLYEIDTDKAIAEIESPWEGTLQEWLAAEGDTVRVGTPIARVRTEASAATVPDLPSADGRPRTWNRFWNPSPSEPSER